MGIEYLRVVSRTHYLLLAPETMDALTGEAIPAGLAVKLGHNELSARTIIALAGEALFPRVHVGGRMTPFPSCDTVRVWMRSLLAKTRLVIDDEAVARAGTWYGFLRRGYFRLRG